MTRGVRSASRVAQLGRERHPQLPGPGDDGRGQAPAQGAQALARSRSGSARPRPHGLGHRGGPGAPRVARGSAGGRHDRAVRAAASRRVNASPSPHAWRSSVAISEVCRDPSLSSSLDPGLHPRRHDDGRHPVPGAVEGPRSTELRGPGLRAAAVEPRRQSTPIVPCAAATPLRPPPRPRSTYAMPTAISAAGHRAGQVRPPRGPVALAPGPGRATGPGSSTPR